MLEINLLSLYFSRFYVIKSISQARNKLNWMRALYSAGKYRT